MIWLHRAMHWSQMKTPGPATRRRTCSWRLPQKEHRAVASFPPGSSGIVPILGPSGLEHLLDRHRDRPGDTPDRYQVIDAGVPDALHAAEGAKQGPAADRSQPRDAVQYRGECVPPADHPVEGDGKPMRLVADSLDEEERLGIQRQADRLRALRRKQLLLLLGQPEGRDLAEPHPLEHLASCRQLALATADQHQVGQSTEARLLLAIIRLPGIAGKPPAEHLLDPGEVVGPLDRLD